MRAQDIAPAADPAEQQAPEDSEAAETFPPDDEGDDNETIVVTGQRSILGDIPPVNVLSTTDVLATGANDINELLDAIAPQIGSAQGRGGERPIMLLNGQRISSFRELRDIPTEAIRSVEILPEEVALRYGYRADQKVVNFVLWPRFRSTTARVEGTSATEGGYLGGEADLTRLIIGEKSRTTLDLDIEANGALTESERDILLENEPEDPLLDPRPARTLVGSRREITLTGTHNRQVGTVSATGNVELQRNQGRSLLGLSETLAEPIERDTVNDSAHAGLAVDGNMGEWRWSVIGNADASRNVTKTDQDPPPGRDRARTTTLSADADAMAAGSLFRLPAGDAGATLRAGASTVHFDSEQSDGVSTSNSLERTIGQAAANLDLPLSKRGSDFAPAGNLTVNANGSFRHLSDFGTLTSIGAGANWSPAKRLNLVGSWTREEGPPTVNQLGDPALDTPDSRIFDFTTGETVLVTAITGGNPGLVSDRRSVWKLGGDWKPFTQADLILRGEYVRTRIDQPISSFPAATETVEAAFPDRFVRDSQGNLVRVDLRPVNFDRSRRDAVRIGFDFSKRLRSAPPSEAARAAFRARRRQSGSRPEGGESPEQPDAERGFRGFGRSGGRNGGRLTFSITDTITLVDDVTIRDGLELDYLHGDALGQSGGRPRHQVEVRAGYFNNGLGARLSANWKSGTNVNTTTGDSLRFSPLATFDLRLWANLGQRFDLVAKHPWLRGTSVRLEVDNIFNSRPRVRDSAGMVPLGYQPDLLDPLGRTIAISIRKLFLPPPGAYRRDRAGRGEE